MTYSAQTSGDIMYPRHTGSVLLDIAATQRNEALANAKRRRRASLALSRSARTPSTRPPKRPWWWGLARNHRAA
jgi:hypothetical protein